MTDKTELTERELEEIRRDYGDQSLGGPSRACLTVMVDRLLRHIDAVASKASAGSVPFKLPVRKSEAHINAYFDADGKTVSVDDMIAALNAHRGDGEHK